MKFVYIVGITMKFVYIVGSNEVCLHCRYHKTLS